MRNIKVGDQVRFLTSSPGLTKGLLKGTVTGVKDSLITILSSRSKTYEISVDYILCIIEDMEFNNQKFSSDQVEYLLDSTRLNLSTKWIDLTPDEASKFIDKMKKLTNFKLDLNNNHFSSWKSKLLNIEYNPMKIHKYLIGNQTFEVQY